MGVNILLNRFEESLPSDIREALYQVILSKWGKRILKVVPPVWLIVIILSIYTHWMLHVLPALLADAGAFWWYLCYIGGTFIFHGICAHYYIMAFRHSVVTEENKIPFIIDDEDCSDSDGPEIQAINETRDSTNGNVIVKPESSLFTKYGLQPVRASEEWHACFACKVYVCPRSYHCVECGKCIQRRDHHCIFTGSCIGRKNHVNFLGFVFFLSLGTISTSITAVILDYKTYGLKCLYNLVKPIFFIFSFLLGVENLIYYSLVIVAIFGIVASSGFLIFYLRMCFRGQTCFDREYGILHSTTATSSYANFENFLGSNTILRILFPLCFQSPTETHSYDRNEFIAKFEKGVKASKQRLKIALIYDEQKSVENENESLLEESTQYDE